MNMLQQKTGLPQFRCLPVAGGRSPSSSRYERMIKGRWISCNHRRVRGIVGVINRRGQTWTNKSQNSTGVTSIPTAGLSTSSDTTARTSALFSCEKAMSMNAFNPCGISKQNSRSQMNNLDHVNFGRYSPLATEKSVAGICTPEFNIAHNRAQCGFFVCGAWLHLSMVGRAGQPKGWPGSMLTGSANPVRLTTIEICTSGGELLKLNIEVAIMATIPTQVAPVITAVDGRAVTTSIAIAEYFAKRHDDVLKKVRTLECSPQFHARNFAEMSIDVTVGNGAVRKTPAYQITRDDFAFLAMGFTGKRAAVFKEAYITAFNAMERALNKHPLLNDRRLTDALLNAQRLHENLIDALELWKKYVAPLKPPIIVGGLLLDASCVAGLLAADIERVMQGTVPDRLRGKTWVR